MNNVPPVLWCRHFIQSIVPSTHPLIGRTAESERVELYKYREDRDMNRDIL